MQCTQHTKDLELILSRAALQEAGSYRPAVRPQRRREMVQELVTALPNALQLLASLLQQPSGKPCCLRSPATLPCMHVATQIDITVIPYSSSTPVHPAYKSCMRWIEQPGLLHVVTVADWSALGAGATPVAAKVLVAFAEWLKLGDAASLQGASLAQHPLLAAALEGLASESAFDEAVDATVELVYCTSSGGQPEPSMLPVVSIIVPSVRFPAAACA